MVPVPPLQCCDKMAQRLQLQQFGFRGSSSCLAGPAYQAILNENSLPIWDEDFVLLQDNALLLKAASTMSFLKENGIMVVNDWPLHSLDLNVIENVWKMLSNKREGKKFTSLNDLWSFLENSGQLHSKVI